MHFIPQLSDLSPSELGFIVSTHKITNITLLTLMVTLQLQGESPTYILYEDTQPVLRAIGVSHTACKDEFPQNIRSHSCWSVFSFFIIFNIIYQGNPPSLAIRYLEAFFHRRTMIKRLVRRAFAPRCNSSNCRHNYLRRQKLYTLHLRLVINMVAKRRLPMSCTSVVWCCGLVHVFLYMQCSIFTSSSFSDCLVIFSWS